LPTIKDMIERFVHEHDVIMFTICMDVIDSAFAPGVSVLLSASYVGFISAILTEDTLSLGIIRFANSRTVCGIAEMNPTYDADNRTAKLVANLVHHFLK
jgi:formiminoglutamase